MQPLQYVLTGTTLIRSMLDMPLPVTITLRSADVSRLIEINTDGLGFFTSAASMDDTTASALVLSIFSRIVAVRVTGVPGDILTFTFG